VPDVRAALNDARLYLCTDSRRRSGDLAEFLDAVFGAGVDTVNDRADIAYAVRAPVLHLGQGDLPTEVARRILGDEPVIGRSTHTAAQLEAAAADPGIDYVCAGPTWLTPTKPGRPAAGPQLLTHAASLAPVRPWFAIGGITSVQRLDDVLGCGASRVVVVRAITDAPDPAAAARDFAERLRVPPSHRSTDRERIETVSKSRP